MPTCEEFLEYEYLRQSGIVNMMDIRSVCTLTGLNRDTVIEIHKMYEELYSKYCSGEDETID